MRLILSERNIVVVLFVMVLVTFSLAHEDSKKMEQIYLGTNSHAPANSRQLVKNETAQKNDSKEVILPAAGKE